MSFDYRQCINSVSFLRDNPIVFDVGCNINKIVTEILKKYGYSEVINSGREKLWSCE
jgi:hypothetical protein